MRFRLFCLALLLPGIQSTMAGPPVLVREHSELSRLLIEGNETFTDSQLQWELDIHLEMLALLRPGTPYSHFAETLQRLITDGYLKSGFADVRVDVNYDEENDRTIVTIAEGQRYRCGDIEVTGVDDGLARLIERRLKQAYVDPNDVVAGVEDPSSGDFLFGFDENGSRIEANSPRWVSGKPVDFYEGARAGDENRVRSALSESGLHGSDVAVSVTIPESGSDATLSVEVRNAGIPIIIKEVLIQGAQRNSADDVMSLLGVVTPVRYTSALRRELISRLWDCGRFRRFSLHVESGGDLFVRNPVPSVLRVQLAEYDGAPLLTEELNDVDRILCQAARWLTTQAGRTHDLVATLVMNQPVGIQRIELALSRDGDAMARVGVRLHPDTTPVTYRLGVDNNRFTVVSELTHRQWALNQDRWVQADVALVGTPEPDSDGRNVSLKFGGGLNGEADGIRFALAAAPMAMLYQARLNETVCTVDDGILSLDMDGINARFEAETGRWIGIDFNDQESGDSGEIRFDELGFDRAMQRWSTGTADGPAVTSFPEFVTGELSAIVSQPGTGQDESIITLAAFTTSLAQRFGARDGRREGSDRRESLRIPIAAGPSRLPMEPDDIRMILTINSFLFPRDSTFWKFGRQLVVAYNVQDEDARTELQRILQSDTAGPLMYWYAAQAFHSVNPPGARAIAREGLNRLYRNRFLEDSRQILSEDYMISALLKESLATLREMDDSQVDVLFTPAAAPEQRAAMIAALRRDGSSDLEVLLSLLGELWDAKLRDLLRQRLIDLSGGPEIRNARRGLRGESSEAETVSAEFRQPLYRVRNNARSRVARASQGSSLDPQGRRR